MSLTAAAIRLMAEKGLSANDIADIAEAMTPARSSNAERQARYRERLDVSNADWLRLRALVFKRDAFECVYCHADRDLACDHVIPLIQGGKSTLDNLVTACRRCNSAKSGRTPEEWRA